MSYSSKSFDDTYGDEDQEEFSLLSNADALMSFREQWQKELEISLKYGIYFQPKTIQDISFDNETIVGSNLVEKVTNNKLESESIETKAKNLFLQGIEHEQTGKLYEAIQFYRRAVQLVPDIEFHLYESTKSKLRDKIDGGEKYTLKKSNDDYDDEDDRVGSEHVDIKGNSCDVLRRLSKVIEQNGCVCSTQFEQSTTHISALPMEIIFYILRWVVSSDLDIRSLEMISRVCRGFYICARDAEIWRMACVRVWGVNCGRFVPKYQSWRDMYMERPRLRYNGCYISKTTYIRHGENSFQDQFYKPWHLVSYFRYIRFFPEGKVLMLTSTDEAQSCVNSLKSRDSRNNSVLIGHYRLHDNCVTLVLKRQEINSTTIIGNRWRKHLEPVHDSGEQTFHVEFEIQGYYKHPNSQLVWLCFIIYTKYKNGQEVPTQLNLRGKYPPFRFNRVKSYTQESQFPLQ